MDSIIPWEELYKLTEPCYYKGVRGNKPYRLELMLGIHILQNHYNLSDEGTRNEIINSRAYSDFRGVESSNQIPDGDTIGRFRNLLIEHSIHEQFFALVVQSLKIVNWFWKKEPLWIPPLFLRCLPQKIRKNSAIRMPIRRKKEQHGTSDTRLMSVLTRIPVCCTRWKLSLGTPLTWPWFQNCFMGKKKRFTVTADISAPKSVKKPLSKTKTVRKSGVSSIANHLNMKVNPTDQKHRSNAENTKSHPSKQKLNTFWLFWKDRSDTEVCENRPQNWIWCLLWLIWFWSPDPHGRRLESLCLSTI